MQTIIAFYHFFDFNDYEAQRGPLLKFCVAKGLKGSILLAPEGINGTVGGPQSGIDALLNRLTEDPRLRDLEVKTSYAEDPINRRMKVKLKQEIVSFEMPGFDPRQRTGTYVDPTNWNALISDPEVTLIDTRNDYEHEVGSFKGAIDPGTHSFKGLVDFTKENLDPTKHKKVAMFCTGGIRCEKSTAWMLEQGFAEVYHLKGGILNYLEQVPAAESLWEGECFVFDERVTVNHQLQPGSYGLCHACRQPISDNDRTRPEFEEGVSCHHCIERTSDEQKAAFRERMLQIKLANERGEQHLRQDFIDTWR